MKKLSGVVLILIFAVFLAAGSAMAGIIDLTDTSNPAIYTGIESTNGSIWRVVVNSPTGTGVYEPFLRYQANPVEIGLNTDLKPPPFDDKMPATIYTRSVLFSDLGVVSDPLNNGGGDYWAFTIDFNEPGNKTRFLSFDNFDIYQGATTDAGAGDSLAGLTKLWNSVDTVLTDYTLGSSGSGRDDYEFFVPVQTWTQPYFYLYIQSGGYVPAEGEIGYGRNWEANGGFEEIRATGIASVPEPATMLLLGSGLIGLAFISRKRFKK